MRLVKVLSNQKHLPKLSEDDRRLRRTIWWTAIVFVVVLVLLANFPVLASAESFVMAALAIPIAAMYCHFWCWISDASPRLVRWTITISTLLFLVGVVLTSPTLAPKTTDAAIPVIFYLIVVSAEASRQLRTIENGKTI